MNLDLSPLKEKGIDYSINSILANYTTFRVGGRAPAVIHCHNASQLQTAVSILHEQSAPFLVIGEGSNILISDQGLDLVVIRYLHDKPTIKRDGQIVHVAGCTKINDLSQFCAQNGMEELNFLSGIPGTVGGAVVGNAGAFGKQIGDHLQSVTLMDRSGKVFKKNANELTFSYRNSSLKESGEIVVEATFSLSLSDKIKVLKERDLILRERKKKHPDYRIVPCAGCVFRNLPATLEHNKRQSIGKILESAGALNLTCGGAAVFRKHANMIVNTHAAKADDVYTLMQMMKRKLKEQADLDAQCEIICLGPLNDLSQT